MKPRNQTSAYHFPSFLLLAGAGTTRGASWSRQALPQCRAQCRAHCRRGLSPITRSQSRQNRLVCSVWAWHRSRKGRRAGLDWQCLDKCHLSHRLVLVRSGFFSSFYFLFPIYCGETETAVVIDQSTIPPWRNSISFPFRYVDSMIEALPVLWMRKSSR